MTSDTVQIEKRGAAGLLRLNRPHRHQALSLELLRAIGDAVRDLETDPQVRAVVITGSDKAFSTGVDLNEALEAKTTRDALRYQGEFRKLGYTIENSPLPTIAAISGYCITGGLELALMCDIRLAAPNAVFGMTSAKIGSVAGGGGTQRLPRTIGAARAKELMYTCDFIDAEEASRINLVNRVVREGDVLQAALDMAQKLEQRGPLSISWVKTAVNNGMNMDLESALALESQLCAAAFTTEDKAEGMAAFLEKRPARFKGR